MLAVTRLQQATVARQISGTVLQLSRPSGDLMLLELSAAAAVMPALITPSMAPTEQITEAVEAAGQRKAAATRPVTWAVVPARKAQSL
jgi:hypothetical protein